MSKLFYSQLWIMQSAKNSRKNPRKENKKKRRIQILGNRKMKGSKDNNTKNVKKNQKRNKR